VTTITMSELTEYRNRAADTLALGHRALVRLERLVRSGEQVVATVDSAERLGLTMRQYADAGAAAAEEARRAIVGIVDALDADEVAPRAREHFHEAATLLGLLARRVERGDGTTSGPGGYRQLQLEAVGQMNEGLAAFGRWSREMVG
jgi:hypothetical protein